MKMLRSPGAASIAAFAALSMTATPVLARGYGGWDRHYRHHHGDGIDGGDVLAGLLIVGGIAAIASAASKSARDDQADERDRYPGDPAYGRPEEGRDYGEAPGRKDEAAPGYGADDRDYGEAGDRDYGETPNDDDGTSDNGSDDRATAPATGRFDDAVARCEDELERGERRIGSVDNVARAGDRYSVEGRLDDGRGFACSVDEDGQVRSVAVDGRALI